MSRVACWIGFVALATAMAAVAFAAAGNFDAGAQGDGVKLIAALAAEATAAVAVVMRATPWKSDVGSPWHLICAVVTWGMAVLDLMWLIATAPLV